LAAIGARAHTARRGNRVAVHARGSSDARQLPSGRSGGRSGGPMGRNDDLRDVRAAPRTPSRACLQCVRGSARQ
jgi:hypothetical protein